MPLRENVIRGFAENFRILTDLVYPARCVLCDEVLAEKEKKDGICEKCAAVLHRVREPFCMKCGRPLDGRMREAEYCRDCAREKRRFDKGTVVFPYEQLQHSVSRFKNDGRAEYAGYFGRQMAETVREHFSADEIGLIVPVPVSDERKKERGYNQAALLAGELSRRIRKPCREDLLVRTKETAKLKFKSAGERRKELSGAFRLNRLSRGNEVKSKKILLVDDIFTTGATIDACAEALFSEGASTVCFVALSAKTG